MRVTQIREKTALIASPISNAYIDFSKMTCSVVAVVTDVVRNGMPVVGYGFNSNGRYLGSAPRENPISIVRCERSSITSLSKSHRIRKV